MSIVTTVQYRIGCCRAWFTPHRIHLCERIAHLGYLTCIVANQEVAHVVAAGVLLGLGVTLLFIEDELGGPK